MQNDAAVNPTQDVPFTGDDEVFSNTVWFSCKGVQEVCIVLVLHTLRALICCKIVFSTKVKLSCYSQQFDETYLQNWLTNEYSVL